MIKALFDDHIVQVYEHSDVAKEGAYLETLANSLLDYKNRTIKIIQRGEAEALACLTHLDEKQLLIDERTTRLLIEDVNGLKDYIENRTKYKLSLDMEVYNKLQEKLKGINVMRSADLAAYAYEKKWIDHKADRETLRSMLYALKFAGCSISQNEINDYVDLIG